MLVLVLCFSLAESALAQQTMPRLVDQADLLNSLGESSVLSALDDVSQEHGLDVVVVTAATLNGQSPERYAKRFYADNGYGPDGILLLVSMEDRDWQIFAAGYAGTVFTDEHIDYLSKQFVPSLMKGNYSDAFEIYAETCDKYLSQAGTGASYGNRNQDGESFNFLMNLVICLAIGFVIALIVTGIMRGQLKSVRSQSGAADYVKADSMNVTHRQDLFLYRQIRKVEKPRNTGGSGPRGFSGRSYGGKF